MHTGLSHPFDLGCHKPLGRFLLLGLLICEDPASFLLRCLLHRQNLEWQIALYSSASGQAVFRLPHPGSHSEPGPGSNTRCALHLMSSICAFSWHLSFVGYTGKQVSICLCPRAVPQNLHSDTPTQAYVILTCTYWCKQRQTLNLYSSYQHMHI